MLPPRWVTSGVLVSACMFGVAPIGYAQTTAPRDAPAVPSGQPTAPAEPTTPGDPTVPVEPTVPPEPTPVTPAEEIPPPVEAPEVVRPAPSVGLDVLYAPTPRGWLTIEPSVAISGEYNDNIFQNNANKEHDFILALTPGVSLALRRPNARLTAGYNFSAELYARESSLSNVGDRQRLFATGSYRASPRLTLAFSDRFVFDQSSNAVTAGGVSTGREEAWSNTFAPALSWQARPLLTLRLFGAHSVQRFSGESRDADTYRVGTAADRILTPRLTGTLAYEFAYIDVEQETSTTTHTPRVGFSYRLTPTTIASANAGVSVVDRDDTELAPAAAVSLGRVFRFGSVSVAYDRAVVAGGRRDVVDQQAFSGVLQLTTLMRGLTVGLSPRYTILESIDTSGPGRTDVRTLNLSVSARYQVAARVTIFAGYNFLLQRSDTPVYVDVDQNRVFVGVQYGYPINFD